MKTTKRSLLTTAVCLLLTAVMLLGSTFAWFTDSVTNTGNEIQSGTLNIELNDGSKNVLFTSENFLWEPGRSQDAAVSVKNVGSLWLKYIVSFDNVVTSGNADITEVLDVYKAEANATSLEGAKKLGTVKELMAAGQLEEAGILAPEGEGTSSEAFTLVIKMQESAGNQYQDCSVNFDVVVSATQTPHEEDGFGNPNYDQGAIFDQVDVSYDPDKSAEENGDALLAAIADAAPGATVYVEEGTYEVTDAQGRSNLILDKPITLVGNGAVLTSEVGNGAQDVQATVVIKSSDVTLDGFVINMPSDSANANKAVEIAEVPTVTTNVTIRNCTMNVLHDKIGIYVGGPNVGSYRIENNTINGNAVSIAISNGAGDAMTEGEQAVITGNLCQGALFLTGTRNTGWDLNELTNVPTISGNTFGTYKVNAQYGSQYFEMYIRVASMNEEKLVDCTEIVKNNTFAGLNGTLAGQKMQLNGTYYDIYGWGTDRSEPAGFEYDASTDTYKVTVTNEGFNATSFYKTQGKKLKVVTDDTWTVSAQIQVTEEMLGSNPCRVEVFPLPSL